MNGQIQHPSMRAKVRGMGQIMYLNVYCRVKIFLTIPPGYSVHKVGANNTK